MTLPTRQETTTPMASVPPAVGPRLLIVDGHAYAYRAFHAIRTLSSPTGQPTNAIFGFIKMFSKMRALLNPSHLVVVWDGGLAAERLTLHPEYKAQRPPMPRDLEVQLDQIVTWLDASGVASRCQEGVEADDWIATMARQAAAGDVQVVIASSDKDFMQLVSPKVGLLNPNDQTQNIWTAAEVRAKTGVEPEQIVDWLSLVGDAVDNIPGVSGVGPKTATRLLQQFGSCEALETRLSEVSSDKVRLDLAAALPRLRKNRELIRLRDDLAGAGFGPALAPKAVDNQRLRDLYSGWGFRSLLRELPGSGDVVGELF